MHQIEADVCVIGAGVAGAIIAQECVDADRDVLMLEAGSRVNGRSAILRMCEKVIRDYRIPRMRLWHRGAHYHKIDYQSTGNPGYDLGGLALVARGGSTLGWGGDAYRLRPEDFRLCSLTGRGLDWPLNYEDLEPYYSMGEETLRVAGDHCDSGHPPRSKPFPLPARPFDVRDKPFLDHLSDLGWSPMHHNISLALDGGAFTADELCDRLERRPNFRLLTHCVTTRILCSSKERAAALECWDLNRGESLTIGVKTVVVCAGGIETPNLLRRSANEWWPNGLGNHSHHLGRHLISHLGIAIGGRPRGFRFINGPIGPTAATRYFDNENEQTSGKYILLWRPAPTGLLFLNACIEQFPNEINSVEPGSAKTRFGTPNPIIHFNYNERDIDRVRILSEHLETLATQIGFEISHRRYYNHAHPMCTSRMTENPRDGVIDSELRIHMMENVHVCGSACFTTGGAVNPTMTIAALAHRLGAYLTNR